MVYCYGCVHLLYTDKLGIPVCLSNARFSGGALRSDIDVLGIQSAEEKNCLNDCSEKAIVSINSMRIKKWVLTRGIYGTKAVSIKDYSNETEKERSDCFRQKKKKRR